MPSIAYDLELPTIVQRFRSEVTGLLGVQSAFDAFGKNLGPVLEGISRNMTEKMTLPVIGVAAASVKAGQIVEDAHLQIQRATGLTGDKLKAVEDAWDKTFSKVPASADVVTAAITQITDSLHLTADQTSAVATQIINLGKLTGQALDPTTVTKWAQQFKLNPAQISQGLNQVYDLYKNTGVQPSQILSATTRMNPVLGGQFGMGPQQIASLVATSIQQGLPAQMLTQVFNRLWSSASRQGMDPKTLLQEIVGAVKGNAADVAKVTQFASTAGPTGAGTSKAKGWTQADADRLQKLQDTLTSVESGSGSNAGVTAAHAAKQAAELQTLRTRLAGLVGAPDTRTVAGRGGTRQVVAMTPQEIAQRQAEIASIQAQIQTVLAGPSGKAASPVARADQVQTLKDQIAALEAKRGGGAPDKYAGNLQGALATLLGPRGGPAFEAAVRGGAMDPNSTKKRLQDIDQAAAKARSFSDQLKITGHNVDLMLAPLGEFLIRFGTSAARDLLPVVKGIGDVFHDMPAPLRDAIGAFAGLAAAAGPMLYVAGRVAKMYQDVSKIASTVAGGVSRLFGRKPGEEPAPEGTSPETAPAEQTTTAATKMSDAATQLSEAATNLETAAGQLVDAATQLSEAGQEAATAIEGGATTAKEDMISGGTTAETDIMSGGATAKTDIMAGAATAETDIGAGGLAAKTDMVSGAATSELDLQAGGVKAGTAMEAETAAGGGLMKGMGGLGKAFGVAAYAYLAYQITSMALGSPQHPTILGKAVNADQNAHPGVGLGPIVAGLLGIPSPDQRAADEYKQMATPELVAYWKQIASGQVKSAAMSATEAKAALHDAGVKGYRRGGWVGGSGSGDKIPALLEPGEFVSSRDMLAGRGPWAGGMPPGMRSAAARTGAAAPSFEQMVAAFKEAVAGIQPHQINVDATGSGPGDDAAWQHISQRIAFALK